jgi:hypothetical protein
VLVVRATKKLRDRVKGLPVREGDASTTSLGDWFATALFWRPHVALLVNHRTLVPVFLELAPAATLLDRVPESIEAILRAHGVDDAFVVAEGDAMQDVRIGPTNDRSVVGVMNEVALHAKFHWQDGIRDFRALSLRTAHLPLGPLRDRTGYPDRELASVVGGGAPPARVIPFPSNRSDDAPVEPAAPAQNVYQLKVTLLETTPPIWRRVLVDGGSTLARVHEVIQAAFGWWNCHLHEFDDGATQYGPRDPDADWEPPQDERRTRLDAIAAAGSTLQYTYDFGDAWEHQVVVERVLPGPSDMTVPACIDGRRACPPEDCGGTGGYRELLTILADPTHPERDNYLEWLGRPFDPEKFDPGEFADNLNNLRLGTIR